MAPDWYVEIINDWTMSHDPDGPRTTDEPLGTKEKFWVRAPDENRYLFKYARVRHGRTMGEDWVEWAVHKLATMLSIPTATAIPALHRGRRGVLSLSVLSRGERLIHGNELLAQAHPDYDSDILRENGGYTVEAVRQALEGVSAPASCSHSIRTAFDAWAGYLALDAWVAGRDRHHENWAAIEHTGALVLAPSFDHGNALGFQESAEKVRELADRPDSLDRWVRRGRSHHFAGRPGLVALAAEALEVAGDGVREHWLGALKSIDERDVEAVLAAVPPEYLSQAGRIFTEKLLHLNRERILHGD